MTETQLNKGLILIFQAIPSRIKKMEKHGLGLKKTMAKNYIESSMEMTLREAQS